MTPRRSQFIVVSSDPEVLRACRTVCERHRLADAVQRLTRLDLVPAIQNFDDWIVLDLDSEDLSRGEWRDRISPLMGQIILTSSDVDRLDAGSREMGSKRHIAKNRLQDELDRLFASRDRADRRSGIGRLDVGASEESGRSGDDLRLAHRVAEFAKTVATLDTGRIVAACLEQLRSWAGARHASLYELDERRQVLTLMGKTHPHAIDEHVDLLGREPQPMTRVAASPRLIHVTNQQDAAEQFGTGDWRPQQQRYNNEGFMIAPISVGGRLIAVLNLSEPTGPCGFDAGFVASIESVCELIGACLNNARLFRRVQEQARTDGLTGLANRRTLMARLNREIMRAQRYDTPLSLIMVDLDELKRVNDTHGHTAGDAALRETARRIVQAIREIDLAARYGGDEFAIVLPNTTSAQARHVADRLATLMKEHPCPWQGKTIALTVSIGVRQYEGQATATELIREADEALYGAKADGKDRVHLAADRLSTYPELNPFQGPSRGIHPAR